MVDRHSPFDLVEAFQLSYAVLALHRLGLLASLKKPATADTLAAEHGLDADLVYGTLAYVAARTDLVRKSGQRFAATSQYSGSSRFLLDLYVGAYGGNAVQLSSLLRDPSMAPLAVDRTRHARAFEAVEGSTFGLLPELIRKLGLNHLLDLGCGSAALLLDLAEQDAHFVGWGIDTNRAMCRAARERIRVANLGNRIRVLGGDCKDLASAVPPKIRTTVRAVTACNVANEMFSKGDASAVSWLRSMRKALPGRPLLIADYYGQLGRGNGKVSRETLLHDYVQLISGQGVPPANVAEWRAIYSRAGCRLVHIIEDKRTTQFIHLLQL